MTEKVEIDPRDIFLKGKNVILKVLTREDVINSGWYGWFNDEILCKTLQKHYFPNTLEAQMAFWENTIKIPNNKLQLGICLIDGGPIVGIVSLNNIDHINSKAEISAVIAEKEARNITVFVESCNLLFNHAFYSLNLQRIYGGSISEDLVNLMCRILKCKKEGISRRDIFKDGRYHDAYRYSLLREEFQQLDTPVA